MARPTVFICHGSSCRDRDEHAEVCARLRDVADISEVRCQDICDGPVVGAAVNGTLEWFERVRSDKVQRHLVDLVAGSGRMRNSLRKRRVGKREGRLR